MENKQQLILDALCSALQLTRDQADLESLEWWQQCDIPTSSC